MITILESESANEIVSARDVPSNLDGRWSRSKIRDPKSVDTLGVHHTAVTGGFGVSSGLLKRHNGDAFAARMERYRGQPYHAIYSPQDQASVIQWPGWMYTWHGNGMNRYSVGWGLDMNCLDQRFGIEDVERAILAGLHVVGYFRDRGFDLRYIETHSQHTNKPHDPCPWVMQEILVPLSLKAGLTIRAEALTGKGRAWDRAQIDLWIQQRRASDGAMGA